MSALTAGSPAPSFTLTAALPGGGEQEVSFSGLTGKWVVVFIYPKDSTSG